MKEPREDDERLSALLEGRVEGRQREDLLAHLAAAHDDYEVFTDTAAVLRALEDEDAPARRPLPPSMRKAPWPSPARAAVYVVGAMVLLVAVGLLLRGGRRAPGVDPLQLAMHADPNTLGLPPGWRLPTSPDGVRGGPAGGTDRDGRAVHAGALLMELAVAIRARDTAQIAVRAAQLQELVAPGASAGAPLRQIEERPDAPRDTLNALLQRETQQLAERLDGESLELGAWLEAARLAAIRQNARFFQDGASGDMLSRAADLAGDDQAARRAVADVRAALTTAGTPRWETLGESLTTLLGQLSA